MPRKIITTEEEALAKVKLKCAVGETPKVEDSEISLILEDNELAAEWEPETRYSVNDLIIPTSGNRVGRLMRCVISGVSGAEEPDWQPVADRASGLNGGIVIGNTGSSRVAVSDGDTSWVDYGPEEDLWDMEQVFHDVWVLKASKVSDLQNVNREGNNYEFNNIYKNCIDQANRYGGKFIV